MLIISSLREEKLLWKKISDFTELISSLGAIPLVITAEEHDFITQESATFLIS